MIFVRYSATRKRSGSRENFFSISDKELVELSVDSKPLPSPFPVKTLDDWERFWGVDERDAQIGPTRFQGGDLVSKGSSRPELLTPADFRLREGSTGYRASKDGKDVGADVDLVGPGAAYERWRKMPEYQDWLKETGQLK